METKSFYPVKKATPLIVMCNSVTEIESGDGSPKLDVDRYTLPDQGFLMAMIDVNADQVCRGFIHCFSHE